MIIQTPLVSVSALYMSVLWDNDHETGNTYEGQHATCVLVEVVEVNTVEYPPGQANGPRLVTVLTGSAPWLYHTVAAAGKQASVKEGTID